MVIDSLIQRSSKVDVRWCCWCCDIHRVQDSLFDRVRMCNVIVTSADSASSCLFLFAKVVARFISCMFLLDLFI